MPIYAKRNSSHWRSPDVDRRPRWLARDLAVLLGVSTEKLVQCIRCDGSAPKPIGTQPHKRTREQLNVYDKNEVIAWWRGREAS